MKVDWIEWFGYLASLVVLISFLMPSIVKLRVINFIGCLLFAGFACLIDSLPTLFVNLSIACINLYYLYRMYRSKEPFKIISTSTDSQYLHHFIEVNQQDIEKQIAVEQLQKADTVFYMLRDNNIAGVLAGIRESDGVFTLLLDYVLPRYRDFKLGNYYYNSHPELIKNQGFSTLKAHAANQDHSCYLQKMGFTPSENDANTYIKRL